MILFFLVKFFTKRQYAESFVNGNLHAKRLKFYRTLEDKSDSHRPDEYEGVAEWMQPGRVQVEIEGIDISNDLAEPLQVNYCYHDLINIYCLHGGMLDDENLSGASVGDLQERLLIPDSCLEMGKYAVVVPDTKEFLRRVRVAALKHKFQVWRGAVEYYDPTKFHGRFEDIKPIFQKRDEFCYQREFRLAFNTRTIDEEPINLFIGDISDIAFSCDSQEVNEFILRSKINVPD